MLDRRKMLAPALAFTVCSIRSAFAQPIASPPPAVVPPQLIFRQSVVRQCRRYVTKSGRHSRLGRAVGVGREGCWGWNGREWVWISGDWRLR